MKLDPYTSYSVRRISVAEYLAQCQLQNPYVLGAVIYGQFENAAPKWPQVLSSLGALGESCVELFLSNEAVRYQVLGELHIAFDSKHLFGACVKEYENSANIEPQTQIVYEQIVELLSEVAMPFIYRMWNELPYINSRKQGIEVYQQFCSGRARAFAKSPWNGRSLPAATAVGSHQAGKALHYFLAGKHAANAIENDAQLSAFNYPKQYGKHAPSFTRAMWQPSPKALHGVGQLWVSGTASIEGHQSLHCGDVLAQTKLALKNIRRLCKAAGERYGFCFNAVNIRSMYRVYLRNMEQLPLIKALVKEEVQLEAQVEYLVADICREELLVEIDAFFEIAKQKKDEKRMENETAA